MVSTGYPLASAEALRVLMEGGNAMDAALTAAGVLSVIKSYHCGLGGDAFVLFYSAKKGKVYALNGSGRSPYLTEKNRYKDGIPVRGILSATVPGTVDVWAQAAERFGSRKLKDLLRPAIKWAEEGFPVFPNLARLIESSAEMHRSDVAWAKVFLPGGKPPERGQLLYQKDLAKSLTAIAEQGRDAFYRGWIAESIVRASREKGGDFSLRDFGEHCSKEEEPLHDSYRGYRVYVPPPNSYGLLLLLQLKLLEQHDLMAVGPNTPECLNLQLRAKEEASRSGDIWLADPDNINRRDLEDFLENCASGFGARDITLQETTTTGGDTTYIAAVDGEGNCVSLIQSVHHSFGSGVLADGTGIVINNRMLGFNLVPGHPNEVGPHKLPAHTLSPAMLLREETPVLIIGTPGGVGQTQFLVQMICNLFDFGMDVQEAIEAPRWQSERQGQVAIEERFPPHMRNALIDKGYEVKVVAPWDHTMGGAEAILIDPKSDVLFGGADPRRDGYAMGW